MQLWKIYNEVVVEVARTANICLIIFYKMGETMSNDGNKTKDDIYIAWALYTGPSNVVPLWKNSRWISGKWNGAHDDTSPAAFKTDIDARIDILFKTLLTARSKIPSTASRTSRRFFVIPEFFFRCKYGPYPYIRIDGELPYEYICSSIKKKLENAFSEIKRESWIICIGSVLTCNVTNIAKFLSSAPVTDRLKALNEKLESLENRQYAIDAVPVPNIKALSYFSVANHEAADENTNPATVKNAINNLMTQYRADPLCVVRNRGAIFTQNDEGTFCHHYEKQNESTVDLTMGILELNNKKKLNIQELTIDGKLTIDGMITEWIAGYPSISIIDGDQNRLPNSPMAARIKMGDEESVLHLGVEICLDHRFKRLRRTAEMKKKNGAAENNPPLHVQLIPSGGMQILDYSVAAGRGGAIFNCDGCDPILNKYSGKGKPVIPQSGTLVGKNCGVYASSAQKMVSREKFCYYSHSQLAFRSGDNEISGYDNASGDKNEKGATYKDKPDGQGNLLLEKYGTAKIFPVDDEEHPELFAAGHGELHIYSMR